MRNFWERVYKTLDTKPENVDITECRFCIDDPDFGCNTACIIYYRIKEDTSNSATVHLTVY